MRHRRRIGETGALDHQTIEGDLAAVQALEQQVQRLGQIGVNGAADAAVGQGHDLHRLVTQQLSVDAGVAEFVFDHGDFQAVLGFQ
ncbi:50S ribosomal protein L18 [Pseudomonas moraviensis R28-S]|uniref:50S ribosomal protein L18 n=1 Tax=Pseudomonas moraviensis R28-S TaxID=1395516 RepID=V8R2S4_9PSED|nr:50S ribosomal protein L18 [Pseudomonas moraviensis R28-S]